MGFLCATRGEFDELCCRCAEIFKLGIPPFSISNDPPPDYLHSSGLGGTADGEGVADDEDDDLWVL